MAKSFIAGENLTGKLGYAVKANTDDKEVVLAGANEVAFGIITNDNVENAPVGVATVGERVLAKLGGSVEHGDDLKVASGGALVKAGGTADDNVCAVAEQDGSSGDLIYVHIVKFVK